MREFVLRVSHFGNIILNSSALVFEVMGILITSKFVILIQDVTSHVNFKYLFLIHNFCAAYVVVSKQIGNERRKNGE